MKYIPHDYQREAIKFGVSRACAGFFLDPGLGKTSIMCAILKVLRGKGIVKRALVIAPLRPAYQVWPAEIQKWDDFNDLKVNVLHGDSKDRKFLEQADIDVVNPEGLQWLFSRPALREMREWPWDMLIVDESTRFKHANTSRFKQLKPLLDRFDRRYILTGSPAPNGLLDLFGQVYLLDLGYTLGKFITHYRMQYFDQTGYGGYTWLPRPGADKQIYKQLAPLVLRMDGKDFLDMPPLIFNEVNVELPEKAMAAYRQMEDLLIASVEDGTVVAANAAAATNKCRQIANGGIYHEGGEAWSHIHEAKTEAVEELVEELQGKPALISYEYRHDLERLQKAFPGAPHIGGGVSASVFRDIERDWNKGLVPVLLAQPQSVAHGLNLQGTSAAVIEHSLTWDLEVREQLIRRVWRQGQKEKVVVHSVVARKTVDELIVKMLAKKDRTQQNLLDALKSHFKGRRLRAHG